MTRPRNFGRARGQAIGSVFAIVAAVLVITTIPAAADHLAPQVFETNGPDVIRTGAVGNEANCTPGFSGNNAAWMGDATAQLSLTFTVPAGHTGVLNVVGYRDAVSRPFGFQVDAGASTSVDATGATACSAVLTATSQLPAGTHTVLLTGTAAGNAYIDYFELVTASVVVPTGSLAITKMSDALGSFDFSVTCPGTAISGQVVTLTVTTAGPPGVTSTPITGIPTGTSCTVTETTAPGFEARSPQTVVIAQGANTVTFSNVHLTGDLVVSKTTIGGTGTFGFTVDCNPGTVFDQTFTLTTNDSRRISGIPTGATCVVTEAASTTFTSVSTPANGTVPIATGDNTVSFVNTIRPPVLTITKVADAATVSSGASVGFTATVRNTGPNPATGATLNDPLPAATGVAWAISPAYAGPGTCSITGTVPSQVLTCAFGSLAPAATAAVHVASATTAATSGTLSNTATAQATNHAAVAATAAVTVNRPSLALANTADAPSVTGGAAIGFTLVVSNAGPGTATNVTVGDPLPAAAGLGWTLSPAYTGPGTCAISGNAPAQMLTCSLGNLATGAGATVHVVSATLATTAGTFTNTATAQADNHAQVATSAASIVVAATGGTGNTGTTTTTTTTSTTTTSPTTTITTATGSTGDVLGETLPRTGTGTLTMLIGGWLLIGLGACFRCWGAARRS